MPLERQPPFCLVGLALLPLLLAVAVLLLSPAPAHAATIVVTGTGNNQIGNDGICTLVEALNNANSDALNHPDCLTAGTGADTIRFNIPSAQCPGGVCTILTEVAYQILGPTTIDGYTQTGASPNTLAVGTNAVLRIVLQPQSASATGALRIQADDVTVRGLVVSGYTGIRTGIDIVSGARARVIGCFIGTDVTGALRQAGQVGVLVRTEAVSAWIGGANPADRNVISGNVNGVGVQGPNAVIQGNAIGTNAAGTAGLSNTYGVFVQANNATVGGVMPGEGNVIAYNSTLGITVQSGVGNRILGNAIYSNNVPALGLGIDLNNNGVTPNDAGDADTGANNLQNYPILTSVGVRVNTTVHGTLNSTPNRQFRVEIFSNALCDQSRNGEGETYLGFVTVTTDGFGNVSFVWTHPQPLPEGRFITATATDPDGNTSEFSTCREAQRARILVSDPLNFRTTEANEGGAFDDQFAVGLPSRPTANVTLPITVSDPTEGRLVTASPLVFTPADISLSQGIHLLGVDDGIDDNDVPYSVVLGPTSSADPNYNGLGPVDESFVNVDNDDRFGAMCRSRPPVRVSVAKIGGGQLRATVTIGVNAGTQNEIQSIAWTKLDTVTVVLDERGPVQQGELTTGFAPLTQSASFVITRTPGASSGTVRLTVTDGCGSWPTFVGGGPRAW